MALRKRVVSVPKIAGQSANSSMYETLKDLARRASDEMSRIGVDVQQSNGKNVVTDAQILSFDVSGFGVSETEDGTAFISNEGLATLHGFASDYVTSEYPFDITHTNPVLSYDEATRVVTLTRPVDDGGNKTSFYYWYRGEPIIVSADQTITHADTTGGHFITMNGTTGKLQVSMSAWSILEAIPVAYVYYDATNNIGICFHELHGKDRNLSTHNYLHSTVGTQTVSGYAISGYTLNLDSDIGITFGVALGVVADEDIRLTTSALADGGPYTILERTGASGTWTWTSTNVLPVIKGTTYPVYNKVTAGVWGRTELATDEWVNYWVFATTSITAAKQVFIVMGQNVYTSLTAAQAESITGLNWGTVPFQELAPLYRVTFRSKVSYGGTTKSRIEDVQRLIGSRSSIGTSSSISVHNALSGRSDPDTHPASSITNTPTAPLTGTNVQTALNEMAFVYNVKSYGALGNGVADDTAGILAAITAAAAATPRGKVYFPRGIYNTTGAFNLDGLTGLSIIGAGVGNTTIRITHATNDLFYTGATVTSNIMLANMKITSDTVTRTAGWVFHVNNAYNGTGQFKKSLFCNLEISKQFNGLGIKKYEFVTARDILIWDPAKVSAPGAGTLSATVAGTKPAATWNYKCTWVTAAGETGLGTVSSNITVDGTKAITITRPASPPAEATGWKVYSSKSGPTASWWVTSATIPIATTTYDDNTADAALTVEATNRSNTTNSAGIGVQAGQTTSTDINQGSAFYMSGVQVYGNDLAGGASLLGKAYFIEDCDAVYMLQCGCSGIQGDGLKILANTGGHTPANHFFVQADLDSTISGHSCYVTGAGNVVLLQFTGCWFASSGRLPGGSTSASGFRVDLTGVVATLRIVGCTFYNTYGNGLRIDGPSHCASVVVGNSFDYCGGGGVSGHRASIYVNLGTSALAPLIADNQETNSGLYSIETTSTSKNVRVCNNEWATATSYGIAPDGIFSGTYTPTLTAGANVTSATSATGYYSRVDNVVYVSGSMVVDPVAASTQTVVGISLPVASNLAALGDLIGSGTANEGTYPHCLIIQDTANDRAELRYYPAGTAATYIFFNFSYQVL